MTDADTGTAAKVARGIVAGVIAGAVASFAMDRFQAVIGSLSSNKGGDAASEPATEKAADAIARQLTGREIARAEKPLAGQALHYALGIGLGVAYGVVAEFRPSVTSGLGAAFGIGTATLLDETIVPAIGLGAAPWKVSASGNLYSYASHLVFSTTTELVRRQVAGTLDAA